MPNILGRADNLNFMQDKRQLDVAVIGCGIAGLTAAHWLSKGGACVTILEKSQAIGGRASTLVRDGFYLNQGPHALYKGGAAYKMLDELNILPPGASPNFQKPLAICKQEFFDLPVDAGLLFKTRLLGVLEKLEFAAFFAGLPKMKTTALYKVSFAAWLAENIRHEKVRQTLSGLARLSTYSNNLDVMCAATAIKQLAMASSGVLYLHHGWKTIVGSLHSTLPNFTTVMLGARVTEVLPSADSVEIVLNGAIKRFDAVVLAIAPTQVVKLLCKYMDRQFLQNIVPSRAACLDVCLKKLPEPKNSFAIGLDEPLYYSVHSRTAELAKPAQATIHLAVYLGDGENGDQRSEARLLELLDKLQPGWRTQLQFKRFLPDMHASYGTPSVKLAGHAGLATPALPDISHVYACGDWVGSDHLLADAAVSSAKAAAKMLLDQFNQTKLMVHQLG